MTRVLCGSKNCSVFKLSVTPLNKFSYSVGSASDWAAFGFVSERLAFHKLTILKINTIEIDTAIDFIRNSEVHTSKFLVKY